MTRSQLVMVDDGRRLARSGASAEEFMMCDCSCDHDYNTRPQVCRVRTRRARVPHVCCECHEEIPQGARYEEVTGLWECGWDRFCTCLPCVGIRRDYCPNGWFYGGLGDQISECLGFSPFEVPEGEP